MLKLGRHEGASPPRSLAPSLFLLQEPGMPCPPGWEEKTEAWKKQLNSAQLQWPVGPPGHGTLLSPPGPLFLNISVSDCVAGWAGGAHVVSAPPQLQQHGSGEGSMGPVRGRDL